VPADATERVERGIHTNEPTDADKPPPLQGDLSSKYEVDSLSPEKFRLKNELFTPANPGSSKRGLPEVLLVKDAAVDANIKVRIPVHIFNTLGGEPVIMVLEGSGPGPAGGGGRDFARRGFGSKMGGRGGGPGPGGGGP